jgi:phosphoribosylformylglycinamidine cyclo-ligase
MAKKSIYEKLGVDPHKGAVKSIFEKIVSNDFPGAFCVMVRDKKNPGFVKVKHSDGSGSKSVQRCLHYFETGDETIFQGDIDDALSSNASDIAASGFVEQYELTDVVNINSKNVPKDIILKQLGMGIQKNIELYKKFGIDIEFLGGETADLPDQVNSYAIDMDIRAETKEKDIIKGNIEAGDLIFGFSSAGQASWEEKPNSGQMTNGLTFTRTTLMHADYNKKYPFLFGKNKYAGKYRVEDYIKELGTTAGEAILSPMRQWAIVIKLLMEELKKNEALHLLHGISINTGGGLTKISNLGKGIKYIKKIPDPPPLFKLIQKESGENWKNMCVTFNMGIGMEVVGSGEGGILKTAVDAVSEKTSVVSYGLGKCEKNEDRKNKVIVASSFGTFEY